MSTLCKVLVVEDELIIRRGLRYLIDWESNGFEIVAETKNGREALEKIERLRPSIVITDIVMPIMDGIQLIKELSKGYPEIQIIVLSAYDNFEYVKSTLQLGAVDYILKPTLNPSELLRAMRTAAERATERAMGQTLGYTAERATEQTLGYTMERASGNKEKQSPGYTVERAAEQTLGYATERATERASEQTLGYTTERASGNKEKQSPGQTADSQLTGFTPHIESRVKQLLSGYGTDETLSAVAENFTATFFLLLGMDMNYTLKPESDYDRLCNALNKEAGKRLYGANFLSLVYDSNVLLLLVNYDEDIGIERDLEQVVKNISEDEPNVFFVCGRSFEGVENIASSYSCDLYPLLRERFYFEHECFLTTAQIRATVEGFKTAEGNGATIGSGALDKGDVAEENGATIGSGALDKGDVAEGNGAITGNGALIGSSKAAGTNASSDSLAEALRDGNVESAIAALIDKVTTTLDTRSLDERRIKSLAQNAVYQIITIFERNGVDQNLLDNVKRDILSRLSTPRFSSEFRKVFLEICDELVAMAIRENKDDGSVMVRMLAYIDANFASQLSLNELAKRFGFSYNYLSAYFGSNNAEGFSRHLNNIRIKKAEELLANPEIQVSEISSCIGYTDHSYFARVFKKLNGMTPSDYRSKLGLEQR